MCLRFGRLAYLRRGTRKHIVVKPKEHTPAHIAVGDVVTLQDRVSLMTVEHVRPSAFGPVVDCCWFDADDALRFRSFPAMQLDIFPRPAPERPIGLNTEVRLRSRGPVMTVRKLRRRDGVALADCAWTGPGGTERRRLFPQASLVLTLLERFEDLGGREL